MPPSSAKKPSKSKIDSCPGVHHATASGKRMRPISTYYMKREQEVLSDMGTEEFSAMVKKIKREGHGINDIKVNDGPGKRSIDLENGWYILLPWNSVFKIQTLSSSISLSFKKSKIQQVSEV